MKQSGANSVITSSDAVGRLLGLSSLSPTLGSVMEDLLTYGEGLEVAERDLLVTEVGKQPQSLPDQVIAVVRDEKVYRYFDPVVTQLARGDRLVVVRPAKELPWAPRPGTHDEDFATDEARLPPIVCLRTRPALGRHTPRSTGDLGAFRPVVRVGNVRGRSPRSREVRGVRTSLCRRRSSRFCCSPAAPATTPIPSPIRRRPSRARRRPLSPRRRLRPSRATSRSRRRNSSSDGSMPTTWR